MMITEVPFKAQGIQNVPIEGKQLEFFLALRLSRFITITKENVVCRFNLAAYLIAIQTKMII